MKKLIASILFLAIWSFGWGTQRASALVTVRSTTLSADIDDQQTEFNVASGTGITANMLAFVNREVMLVTAISGTKLTVRRGQSPSSNWKHTSGDTIYVDLPAYFSRSDLAIGSRCVSTDWTFTPHINVATGSIFSCSSGKVVPEGITAVTLTSPTITTDIRAVTAGGATLGTAALPFSTLYLGDSGTNRATITGTFTAPRTFTVPDIASSTVAMIAGAQTFTDKTLTSPTMTNPALGAATGSSLTLTGTGASIFAAGRVGSTNPVIQVDASTASVVTGLKLTGAAAAGGMALGVISSGADEALSINAKGAGAIAIGNVSTGEITVTPIANFTGTLKATNAATVGTTLTVTGATTPTGGVAAAGGYSTSCRNFAAGGLVPAVSTDFTDSTPVITETYMTEVFVAANCTATGVALFNGSNVTGNVIVAIVNAGTTQTPLANSALTGTAGSGTDAYQLVPFTGTIALKGPATYFILTQYSSGTARYNSPPLGAFGTGVKIGETFGTLTTYTTPTTFAGNIGNIASLY